jgi:hypothetical protein
LHVCRPARLAITTWAVPGIRRRFCVVRPNSGIGGTGILITGVDERNAVRRRARTGKGTLNQR